MTRTVDVSGKDILRQSQIWREEAAGNHGTPPDVLAALTRDESWVVRQFAARNPNTPTEVLAPLAEDRSILVREKLAYNPNTPEHALRTLAGDKVMDVRRGVASNPSTPSDVLSILARDPHSEVRDRVPSNTNTPEEALAYLISSGNGVIQRRVADNPNVTIHMLETLAREGDWIVCCSVARNPRTPQAVLKMLAGHESRVVREVVREIVDKTLMGMTMNQQKRSKFSVTYEVVTEESAELGDAEERGVVGEFARLKDAIEAFQGDGGVHVDGPRAIEPDSVPCERPRWITCIWGQNFQDGSERSTSLHIPESVTAASARRIALLAGVERSRLRFPEPSHTAERFQDDDQEADRGVSR